MELHPKPKQPIALNRPLIITVAVVVVTILLFAIVAALTTTSHVKTNDTVPTAKLTDDKLTVTAELNGLPENYSDVETIKKYSADSSLSQLEMLQEQFRELQSEYSNLRRQLAERDTTPKKPPVDPNLQKIKETSMVFGGVGSKIDSLLGGPGDKEKPVLGPDGKEIPVPSPQQEEFYKKQTEDAHKLATMKGQDRPEDIYDLHNIVKPVSKYQIMSGTLIPAVLITGIDTSLSGTIVAQVRSHVFDTVSGKHLLIPRGSKLIGEYESRVSTGQRRVLLAFSRIVRPDGTSILLGKNFYGVDGAGTAGIEGSVDNHWARIIGASTISAILSIGAGIGGGNSSGNNYPSWKERMGGGLAQSFGGIGSNIVNRELSVPPKLTLPPGHQFNISVRKDMIVTPYNSRNY